MSVRILANRIKSIVVPETKEEALELLHRFAGGRDESDIGINDDYWAVKNAVMHAYANLPNKVKEVIKEVEEEASDLLSKLIK
jgi:hypothetical protein